MGTVSAHNPNGRVLYSLCGSTEAAFATVVGPADLRVDPSGAAGQTVRTGDLGWFDEAGRLCVAAREDDLVIVGGENAFPVRVENVLGHHPDIVEAAVVGAADGVLGQGLVAHVVARWGARFTATVLRKRCRAHLASFQVPRRFVFHRDLPHGETGKVLKRSLTGRFNWTWTGYRAPGRRARSASRPRRAHRPQ